jgi:membrane associated rhomboid family serine protease
MSQFRSSLLDLPPVVKNLLIVNILLLLATYVAKSKFGIDLSYYLGLHFPKSDLFQPHQIFTHMFMHGGIEHLFFNMFALFMFGRVLESVWGPKRFLLYYLVTGVGAAVLHSLVNWIDYSSMISTAKAFANTPSPELFISFIKEYPTNLNEQLMQFAYSWMDSPNIAYINEANIQVAKIATFYTNIPTVGASGAVFGILLAFGMLFPNTELMLLFPPIPIKAKYFVVGYGVLELFLGVQQRSGDNVAHFAHLGGMLFGFILIKYWQKNSSKFY